MIKFDNQRGSITLYVLLSMLFFLIVTGAAFISMKNKETIQDREIARIKESYEQKIVKRNEIPEAGTPVDNPDSYGPNAQATADGKGQIFALPEDGTYIEGTVDTGVVIEYKGSEFVWIPVNSDLEVLGKNGVSTGKKMAKPYSLDANTIDSNGRTKYEGVLYDFSGSGTDVTSNANTSYNQSDTNSYKEPAYLTNSSNADASTYNTVGITEELLQEEYDAMIESVKKYGGFYVGRYESSLNGTVAASKSGVLPMSAAEAEGNRWYGLYQKQKDFTTSSDSMVAGMIWGSQYDAMLNWVIGTETDKAKVMQNSNGNHQGSSVGAVECGSYGNGSDKMNNIYDLEGNLYEWTKEANGTNRRVHRGGNYDNTNYPYYRTNNFPNYTLSINCYMLSLYIK